jgi:hypothetical protein
MGCSAPALFLLLPAVADAPGSFAALHADSTYAMSTVRLVTTPAQAAASSVSLAAAAVSLAAMLSSSSAITTVASSSAGPAGAESATHAAAAAAAACHPCCISAAASSGSTSSGSSSSGGEEAGRVARLPLLFSFALVLCVVSGLGPGSRAMWHSLGPLGGGRRHPAGVQMHVYRTMRNSRNAAGQGSNSDILSDWYARHSLAVLSVCVLFEHASQPGHA